VSAAASRLTVIRQMSYLKLSWLLRQLCTTHSLLELFYLTDFSGKHYFLICVDNLIHVLVWH